jgi:hypothetical protein
MPDLSQLLSCIGCFAVVNTSSRSCAFRQRAFHPMFVFGGFGHGWKNRSRSITNSVVQLIAFATGLAGAGGGSESSYRAFEPAATTPLTAITSVLERQDASNHSTAGIYALSAAWSWSNST